MQNASFEFSHPSCLPNMTREEQVGIAKGAAKIPELPKHCSGAHGPNGIEKANIHLHGLTKCDAEKTGTFRHGAVFG